MEVVNSLCHDEQPVLVRENSGLDFVFVVASLAQLILDPYYRTIRGFQTLIQKMWVLGGHPFLQRCGHLKRCGKDEKEETAESPVFLHFLDCVYQLTHQFPSEFEFSEPYLFGLLDTMNACMFDTFLFDSEQQREEHCKSELGSVPVASLWDFLAEQLVNSKNAAPFINPLFEFRSSIGDEANGSVEASTKSHLIVNTSAPAIRFWSGCYLRWLPTVDVSIGMGDNSSLHLQQMILMNEVKVLRHHLAVLKFDSNPDKTDFGNHTTGTLELDFDSDFNIDLDTSRLLTPSMPFVGDLALSKYYSGDISQIPDSETVDLGKF